MAWQPIGKPARGESQKNAAFDSHVAVVTVSDELPCEVELPLQDRLSPVPRRLLANPTNAALPLSLNTDKRHQLINPLGLYVGRYDLRNGVSSPNTAGHCCKAGHKSITWES